VQFDHALTSKRPRARYLVGTNAKIQSKLALLPDRAREFASGKAQISSSRTGRRSGPANPDRPGCGSHAEVVGPWGTRSRAAMRSGGTCWLATEV
jgi:hypothetical protein